MLSSFVHVHAKELQRVLIIFRKVSVWWLELIKHLSLCTFVHFMLLLFYLLHQIGCSHRGSTGWQKRFLRTAYHEIWPPLTYV